MGNIERLTEHASIDLLDTVDIGGTNAQNNGGYLAMKNYSRVMAYVELGTNSDALSTAQLQQATSSAGAGVKDLTTSASAGNYDTDNPINAIGEFVIFEARGEDFDVDNLFNFVRLNLAMSANTGTDNVTGVLIRYGFKHPQKEIQGAASVGAQVYVSPNS